ncbi:hypothetical protein BFP76_08910 [Amylibacter kogurei]|uniref:Uncharacterized protein n=1 Tax=Paramylibacter kogurei TaxID=1889778 RepID=A0A2G5K2I0_9RHOB|nr:hypothetical protein BFP76_08910 [Amylibacter kogurei]
MFGLQQENHISIGCESCLFNSMHPRKSLLCSATKYMAVQELNNHHNRLQYQNFTIAVPDGY